MVKLSEQIRIAQEKRGVPTRQTRTQRKIGKRVSRAEEVEIQRKLGIIDETEKKLEGLSVEEYEQAYIKMEGWLKEMYPTPAKVKEENVRGFFVIYVL